jgi:hypothetical protein
VRARGGLRRPLPLPPPGSRMQQLSQPLLTTFKIALTHEFVQKHYSHVKYFPHSLSVKLRFSQFAAEAAIPDVALIKEDTVDPSSTVIQTTFYLWFEHTHLSQALVQEEAQSAFIESGALVVPTYQTPEGVGLQDHLQAIPYSGGSDMGGGPGDMQQGDPDQMGGGLLPAMSPVNTGFSRNSFRCARAPRRAGQGRAAQAVSPGWQGSPAGAQLGRCGPCTPRSGRPGGIYARAAGRSRRRAGTPLLQPSSPCRAGIRPSAAPPPPWPPPQSRRRRPQAARALLQEALWPRAELPARGRRGAHPQRLPLPRGEPGRWPAAPPHGLRALLPAGWLAGWPAPPRPGGAARWQHSASPPAGARGHPAPSPPPHCTATRRTATQRNALHGPPLRCNHPRPLSPPAAPAPPSRCARARSPSAGATRSGT